MIYMDHGLAAPTLLGAANHIIPRFTHWHNPPGSRSVLQGLGIVRVF